MVVTDELERFRIEGLVTVALYDDSEPRKLQYIVYPPDYEERKENERLTGAEELYGVYSRVKLISVLRNQWKLKKFKQIDFNIMLDQIYTWGGVNINDANGGWRAFVPLDTENYYN